MVGNLLKGEYGTDVERLYYSLRLNARDVWTGGLCEPVAMVATPKVDALLKDNARNRAHLIERLRDIS